MSENIELVIGKRGEIYTTAELREGTGLIPGGRAGAKIVDGKLVIEAKPTALSLLRKPRVGKKIQPSELERARKEIGEELEKRSP